MENELKSNVIDMDLDLDTCSFGEVMDECGQEMIFSGAVLVMGGLLFYNYPNLYDNVKDNIYAAVGVIAPAVGMLSIAYFNHVAEHPEHAEHTHEAGGCTLPCMLGQTITGDPEFCTECHS